tara:strand:- start:280 stop:453 length:174 start_codon:yes stop_codon:yes gene_type:complete
MDKGALIILATPASIFALALSITTLPFIAKASGVMAVEGSSLNRSEYGRPIHVKIVK